MKMRFLGRSGLQVSELCLGTANFGAAGVYEQSGKIDQPEADYIVGTALDAGVNFFNTAERYSYGVAEEMFGKSLGTRRREAIIITKINPARTPGPNDGGLSRSHIIEGCNASLKRLCTDYIDIYEIHEFDKYTSLEVALRALDDLVRSGKVRYIGCSNFTGWQIMKSIAISEKNILEKFMALEAKYSLASRGIEYEVVPVCLDQGVSILAWSPLHGGYLTGKYRRDQPWPEGTRFTDTEDKMWPVEPKKLYNIIDELDQIAKIHNTSVSGAAMNYILHKPAVIAVIFGIRNAAQLEENVKSVDWQMTEEEIARLDSVSEPPHDYPYYVWDPEAGTYCHV
jgi:aryl-alcohol dehydrogenase-like predicted oxidoreductase